MMLFQDTTGRCCKERLQAEAQGPRRIAYRDTSRKENESRSGCPVDQDDQGTRVKDDAKSHRGGVSMMHCSWMNWSGDLRKSFQG